MYPDVILIGEEGSDEVTKAKAELPPRARVHVRTAKHEMIDVAEVLRLSPGASLCLIPGPAVAGDGGLTPFAAACSVFGARVMTYAQFFATAFDTPEHLPARRPPHFAGHDMRRFAVDLRKGTIQSESPAGTAPYRKYIACVVSLCCGHAATPAKPDEQPLVLGWAAFVRWVWEGGSLLQYADGPVARRGGKAAGKARQVSFAQTPGGTLLADTRLMTPRTGKGLPVRAKKNFAKRLRCLAIAPPALLEPMPVGLADENTDLGKCIACVVSLCGHGATPAKPDERPLVLGWAVFVWWVWEGGSLLQYADGPVARRGGEAAGKARQVSFSQTPGGTLLADTRLMTPRTGKGLPVRAKKNFAAWRSRLPPC
ncbi:hypothetical protein DIPPA_10477 [Diplonema papillatum]|nr:hypothetical protein DIPPA_10477 [Diplonema papillatum]